MEFYFGSIAHDPSPNPAVLNFIDPALVHVSDSWGVRASVTFTARHPFRLLVLSSWLRRFTRWAISSKSVDIQVAAINSSWNPCFGCHGAHASYALISLMLPSHHTSPRRILWRKASWFAAHHRLSRTSREVLCR